MLERMDPQSIRIPHHLKDTAMSLRAGTEEPSAAAVDKVEQGYMQADHALSFHETVMYLSFPESENSFLRSTGSAREAVFSWLQLL